MVTTEKYKHTKGKQPARYALNIFIITMEKIKQNSAIK